MKTTIMQTSQMIAFSRVKAHVTAIIFSRLPAGSTNARPRFSKDVAAATGFSMRRWNALPEGRSRSMPRACAMFFAVAFARPTASEWHHLA